MTNQPLEGVCSKRISMNRLGIQLSPGWKAHAAAQHARCSAGIDSLREEIGKALYVRNHGPNPDWPIGVDKLGYQQEPYVKHVPAWEWFHGGDADAVLSVIHGVAQPSQEQK